MSRKISPSAPGNTAGIHNHWAWRMHMAERIAASLDSLRFGVAALYVLGSAKNATAGSGSDIDLLVHFRGSGRQRADLILWLEGWSLCLDEVNFLRTGIRTGGLLDIHIITDDDIAAKSSFAVRIGAATDAARPLPLHRRPQPSEQLSNGGVEI